MGRDASMMSLAYYFPHSINSVVIACRVGSALYLLDYCRLHLYRHAAGYTPSRNLDLGPFVVSPRGQCRIYVHYLPYLPL